MDNTSNSEPTSEMSQEAWMALDLPKSYWDDRSFFVELIDSVSE